MIFFSFFRAEFFFFKILFIYLTERERTPEGGAGEGEAGFPLSREPDAGFDPIILGSRPESKAGASRLDHARAPKVGFLLVFFKVYILWAPGWLRVLCPTLDVGSGGDLRVLGSSPESLLRWAWNLRGIPSLPLFPPLLPQINQ